MDITLTLNQGELVLEDPTTEELIETVIAQGFTDEEGEPDFEAFIAASNPCNLTLTTESETFDLTPLFLEEPLELIEALNELDLGALTFLFDWLGTSYVILQGVRWLRGKCDDVFSGSFDAEFIVAELYPDLFQALKYASALSYFQSERYTRDCVVVNPRWHEGKDYWAWAE